MGNLTRCCTLQYIPQGVFLKLIFWYFCGIRIVSFAKFTPKLNHGQNLSATFAGILFIPVLLGTAIDLRQFDQFMGTQLTFAIVIAVWACDSAAFIFGTLFGKKKILPDISPKKSWIGSVSGLVAAIVVFYLFSGFN